MSTPEQVKQSIAALQMMTMDILEQILSLSDNPGLLSEYLTRQLRELLGARYVILMQYDPGIKNGSIIINLCPERYKASIDVPELYVLTRYTVDLKHAEIWDPVNAPKGVCGILEYMRWGAALAVPLSFSGTQYGVLLILDLFDMHNAKSLKHTLETLAHIFALILKNSMQYKDMERIITMRTGELYRSEKLFRTLTEVSPVGIFRTDCGGRILYINERWGVITGMRRERVMQKCWLDFIAPESRAAMDAVWAVRESDQRRISGILQYGVRKVWIICELIEDTNEDNEKIGYIGTITDISEQITTQSELKHYKNYLTNIIDSMPSMLIGVNEEYTITLWNKQAELYTGYSSADSVNCRLSERLADFYGIIEQVDLKTEQQDAIVINKVPIAKNEALQFFDITIYPVKGQVPRNAVILIENITEKTKIQELIIKSEKMTTIGGLAAGMAHEINNPLGIISQAAQNIERRLSYQLAGNLQKANDIEMDFADVVRYCEEREIYRFIDDIKNASQRAGKIIANMLQFSRQSEVEKEDTDIKELLQRSIDLALNDIDIQKLNAKGNVVIRKEFADEECVIPVIALELEQVIINLIKNGVQAFDLAREPDKIPEIVVRLSKAENVVTIEIEDNGPGMPEEVRSRIFEPFFTTKPPGSGTGLGLSVSHAIITQNHNGMFRVTSTPGEGALFTIVLPGKSCLHG